MPQPPAGGQPLTDPSDITAAIETFLACGLSPRQILQLAGLCREVQDAGYGEVHSVFADRRIVLFRKQFGEQPLK